MNTAIETPVIRLNEGRVSESQLPESRSPESRLSEVSEKTFQKTIEQAVRGWLIKDITDNLQQFDLPTLYQLQFIATCTEAGGGDLSALARYMEISLDRMGLWPESREFVPR